MSFLDEYKETREKFREMHSMILNDVDKGYGDKVAESIGILENSRIVFESYPERDAFFDFMVHGEIIDGKSSLSAYLEKSRESKDSNKLFRIMKASEVSLYEIEHVDRESNTIRLNDILNPSLTHEVIDFSLSQTINENVLLCTRLYHLESYSMTSGLMFLFDADHREYLRRRSRKIIKKIKAGNVSDKRFLAFFDLNRRDGLPAALEEVE